MSNKQVLPWKVQVGDRIVYRNFMNMPTSSPVKEIAKEKGRCTGASMWRFKLQSGHEMIFHGKLNNLPPEKVAIVTD